MPVLTASATERPHIGDFQFRKFTIGAVADGDTFTIPGGTSIRVLGAFTCNAAGAQVSWTLNATTNVLTAVATGAATAVQLIVIVA